MTRSLASLEGRTALVTGGSGGIGSAIACELARAGARVVVHYHSAEAAARAVVSQIAADGGVATAIQADVADPKAAEQLIAHTVEHYQGLDILVNNAGTMRDQFVMRMSDADWDTVLRTNLYGPFYCCRAAIKPLIRRRGRGRIINIASIAGLTGKVKQANYAASKSGLIGLTRSLARELAHWQVTVNAVAPGFIATEMTNPIPADEVTRVMGLIPLQRPGTPHEVAAAVAFLGSDAAAYITGQVLRIDGGLAM